MKLDIQKFATGAVELNVEKEYTYEQKKISSVKVTVTPISNGEDFENDFVCSIDDDGWTSTGSNGTYYKVFTENVDKIIMFTYDGPARFIGEINLTINDIYDFYDLTICIDKQPIHNPSSELREYTLKLLAPLRSYIDVADQFILDSEGNYKVIRNVEKYLGSLRRLPTPIEETTGKMNIELFEGDNYVYLKENGNYLMKIQYLTNSELNKTFATKMEMNSRFEQTVDGFNLIVSKKVDNDEVCSLISQSAEEILLKGNRVIIESDNFTLTKEGEIEATTGNVGGFTLGKKQFSSKIYSNYDYKQEDLTNIQKAMLGQITLTNEEFEKYDINCDGKISAVDFVKIQKIIKANISSTRPGVFELNNDNCNDTITLKDGDGNKRYTIGLSGAYFDFLSVNTLLVADKNFAETDGLIEKFSYPDNGEYLHVDTAFGIAKGISWWDSDEKLKTNIKSSNISALDMIKNIKHREYDRIDRKEHSKLGYVAQELQEIDESLVFGIKQPDGTTILNINQPNLIPYLTKAIQEQQTIIEKLGNRIEQLEKKVGDK